MSDAQVIMLILIVIGGFLVQIYFQIYKLNQRVHLMHFTLFALFWEISEVQRARTLGIDPPSIQDRRDAWLDASDIRNVRFKKHEHDCDRRT